MATKYGTRIAIRLWGKRDYIIGTVKKLYNKHMYLSNNVGDIFLTVKYGDIADYYEVDDDNKIREEKNI